MAEGGSGGYLGGWMVAGIRCVGDQDDLFLALLILCHHDLFVLVSQSCVITLITLSDLCEIGGGNYG